MENLPEEIIMDILLRLPVKSVVKARCVSKSWKSLLCQPQFIKSHLIRTQQQPSFAEESLILVSKNRDFLYCTESINAYHPFNETTLVANKLNFSDSPLSSGKIWGISSCNGLILFGDSYKKLLLINPATREVKVLPSYPCSFDSGRCVTSIAIGYDSVSDDHKVVAISCFYERHTMSTFCERIVNVYSVQKGMWKRAENNPTDEGFVYRISGSYVNGYIHWMAIRNQSNNPYFVIKAFDVHEEKFRDVPRPSIAAEIQKHECVHYEIPFGTSPHHAARYYLDTGAADIWNMGRDHKLQESWSRLFHDPELMMPVCFTKKQQLILGQPLHGMMMDHKLVLYNLEDETFGNVLLHGIPDPFFVHGTFIQSLVSPHSSSHQGAREC